MLQAIFATPTYGGHERNVCFYFVLYLNISNIMFCLVCSESDHLNKKQQQIISTMVSKHFGHVTF